jgi:ribonuclease HII
LKPAYCLDDNDVIEVGVDEAGRGPMLGRVYAGAVILPKDMERFNHALMKDSKKFTSEKKIKEVAAYIKANAISWGVGYADEAVIDKINIRNATHRAMHDAINKALSNPKGAALSNPKGAALSNPKGAALSNPKGAALSNPMSWGGETPSSLGGETPLLLVDGNDFTPFRLSDADADAIPHVCVEGGDNTFSAIAAASILAKVSRDEYIAELCATHPLLDERYGLLKNKGYGTKKHMDGIKAHGISEFHRKSFGICREYA